MKPVAVFVDSNVILDMINQDPVWFDWSDRALARHADSGLVVNAMVYSELCCSAASTDEVDALLAGMAVTVADIPRAALFLASKAHLLYRRRGGARTSALPDFFIGAHAQILGMAIMTRDTGRYRTYFPQVPLISP